MHVQDLITVEKQLGYKYELNQSPTEHYQWICPPCRRACSDWLRGNFGPRPRQETKNLSRSLYSPIQTVGKGINIMAALPATEHDILDRFGPHLSYSIGGNGAASTEPDKLVRTHCCFCGQQCGIQLKVKGNQVVGFEPWEEFPFNKGMLCPKGVKRYLQGSHPDRLLQRYEREPKGHGGFIAVPYNRAVEKVAEAIQHIQSTHGNDAFAVLSGASLTTEKAYLMGKFARMCLKTRYIDYNGRLCMVSAGAANKKAFGIDRAANSWSDILKAKVVWVSGANIAECAPITTHYIWQAREHGAKIIMVDPRITPAAHTCDLFLPVKPGRDIALFNGILHLMIENDWIDHDFIEEHTIGFDKVAEHVRQWTPRHTAEVSGVAERSIRQAAEMWGTAETSFLLHARGIEHHTSRRPELSRRHQHCDGVRAHRSGGLRLRHHHRPSERAGRPRTGPEMRSAAWRRATLTTPNIALTLPRSGASTPRRFHRAAWTLMKSFARLTAAKFVACLAFVSIPKCRCRTAVL